MDQSIGDFNTMHGSDTPANFSLEIGSRIGDYIVLENIDKGGMGEVYRVQQVNLGTEFALKVLLPEPAKNPIINNRFELEARIMAALSHPNIIKVFYFGTHREAPYMVMDLIKSPEKQAPSLQSLISKSGRLHEDQVGKFVTQMCSALIYMHTYKNQGIIHRDLKPANILFNELGDLFITDFGLAKVNIPELKNQLRNLDQSLDTELSIGDMNTMSDGASSHDLTMEGSVLGTYDFMSPEIMEGQEATAQSDIYAVGVILYKMLTGHIPRGRFKPPSSYGCSSKWDLAIESCLENDIKDRPQSITEFYNILEKAFNASATDISPELKTMGDYKPEVPAQKVVPSANKTPLKLAKTKVQDPYSPPQTKTAGMERTHSAPEAHDSIAFKVKTIEHRSEANEDYKHLGFCDALNKCLAGIWFIPLLPATLLIVFGFIGITVDDHELADYRADAIICWVLCFIIAWSHQERKSFIRIPCIILYLGTLFFSIYKTFNTSPQWLYLSAVSILGLYALILGKRLFTINSYESTLS